MSERKEITTLNDLFERLVRERRSEFRKQVLHTWTFHFDEPSGEALHHHFAKMPTDPSSGSVSGLGPHFVGVTLHREEAMPIKPILGSGKIVEQDDVLTASASIRPRITPAETDPEDTYRRSLSELDREGEIETAEAGVRRIVMPPGYRMERVASWVFFFAPKTFKRISEETIGDYRHEMVEAEARGKSPAELRKLRAQHWGGFVWALVLETLRGVVSPIVKALKGG